MLILDNLLVKIMLHDWFYNKKVGDNMTTSQGGQEQDATRGKGGGEGKLVDVRWRCHKRQRGNQSGQTRGEQEVELPVQCKAAAV